jgi:hypothetical protein
VTINGNQTLSGTVYNQIQVRSNATLTFSEPNVYIKEFKTFKGAKVEFDGCTNLFIQEQLKVEEEVEFNIVSAQQVTIYVDADVQIKRGAKIRSRIHANDNKIQVIGRKNSDDIEITGQFIARDVQSGRNVIWNADTFCIPCSVDSNVDYSNPGVTDTEGGTTSRSASSLDVEAYPNPSSGNFNLSVNTENTESKIKITVFDMNNRQVYASEFDYDQTHRFGAKFEAGVYLVRIQQGDKMQMLRLTRM